jgi:hypothetical protein
MEKQMQQAFKLSRIEQDKREQAAKEEEEMIRLAIEASIAVMD